MSQSVISAAGIESAYADILDDDAANGRVVRV